MAHFFAVSGEATPSPPEWFVYLAVGLSVVAPVFFLVLYAPKKELEGILPALFTLVLAAAVLADYWQWFPRGDTFGLIYIVWIVFSVLSALSALIGKQHLDSQP